MKKIRYLLCGILCGMVLLAGCSKKTENRICIAEQYGIAYAPLAIMKEQQLLEKRLPGVEIEWKQFGGPTAIREGMLAGEIDFGFMGPAPVLVGIDNGMKWKYAAGISFNAMEIMVKDPAVNSLHDLAETDRIAILSPACTQHVLLCMAAEKEFGDPNYFDSRLVSMSHPDAMNALLADTEVSAHLATPPYIDAEQAAGMHSILSGEEIMGGPFTFITCVAMEDFFENRRGQYDAFLDALEEAIAYINENTSEAVRMLAPVYEISEEELLRQMTWQGTIYSPRLDGIEKLSEGMHRMGFTKGNPAFSEVAFPNVNGGEG